MTGILLFYQSLLMPAPHLFHCNLGSYRKGDEILHILQGIASEHHNIHTYTTMAKRVISCFVEVWIQLIFQAVVPAMPHRATSRLITLAHHTGHVKDRTLRLADVQPAVWQVPRPSGCKNFRHQRERLIWQWPSGKNINAVWSDPTYQSSIGLTIQSNLPYPRV